MIVFRDIMIALGFASLEVTLLILICWRIEVIMKRRMAAPVFDAFKKPVTTVHLPEVMNDNG